MIVPYAARTRDLRFWVIAQLSVYMAAVNDPILIISLRSIRLLPSPLHAAISRPSFLFFFFFPLDLLLATRRHTSIISLSITFTARIGTGIALVKIVS